MVPPWTPRPLLTKEEISTRLQPVLLGGEILSYSFARCFQECYGIRSIVLSSVDVKVTSSSSFIDYRVTPVMSREGGAIVAMLMDLGRELRGAGKIALVMGSADWHARLLSEYKEELSEFFVVPYNDFTLLDDITQKDRFYQICEELGIAYPRTWIFNCADQTVSIPVDSFTYPLIAKPSNSARYDLMDFPGKEKVYEVHSPTELTRVFDLLQRAGYDRELVVQDFIPGEDDAIRSLTTFSDAAGSVRAVSGGRVVVQDHSPRLIGNPLCILSERVERVIEDARRFCAHVGYRGFANFDVKFDARDGRYKFFEVNTRPGRNTYYMTLGGMNMAKLLVDEYVLGNEIPYLEAYKPFLYSCVPPIVIRRTVHDDILREQVLEMYRAGQARFPYFCPGEPLAQRFFAEVTYWHQVQKFKRYVWDVCND